MLYQVIFWVLLTIENILGQNERKRYIVKPLVFVCMIFLGKVLVIGNGHEGNFTYVGS